MAHARDGWHRSQSHYQSNISLGQSPHHGSFHNHNNTFWKKRDRDSITPIVFSVGKNSYKHPGEKVVSFFRENDFDIHSTNKVGGIEISTPSQVSMTVSNHFDVFSNITSISTSNSKLQGDQKFTIDSQGQIV